MMFTVRLGFMAEDKIEKQSPLYIHLDCQFSSYPLGSVRTEGCGEYF